jgi:hypothetical protein
VGSVAAVVVVPDVVVAVAVSVVDVGEAVVVGEFVVAGAVEPVWDVEVAVPVPGTILSTTANTDVDASGTARGTAALL